MFPTRILLAAEGSEDAKRAIKTAIGLSTKLESELLVVYVAPEHPYVYAYYDLRHQEEEERLRRGDQRVLDECVDHVRKAGGTVTESYLERLSQQLGRSPVSAVPEEPRNVRGRHRTERPAHRFDQRFAGACPCSA